MADGQERVAANRPRFGMWGGRYYASLVVLGYGISVGPWMKGIKQGWAGSALPIKFFRDHSSYRGLR